MPNGPELFNRVLIVQKFCTFCGCTYDFCTCNVSDFPPDDAIGCCGACTEDEHCVNCGIEHSYCATSK